MTLIFNAIDVSRVNVVNDVTHVNNAKIIEKRAMDKWDLFDCLQTYKKIINEEEEKRGKNAHFYINVSTGSKVSSIAGTLACMIWKETPYYAHMEYNDKKDSKDGLPDEDVTAIDEIPVYSINKP